MIAVLPLSFPMPKKLATRIGDAAAESASFRLPPAARCAVPLASMSDPTHYVPADRQVLTPYICPRDADAAIAWYVAIFGALETSDRFVDKDGRVGHAEITIDGARIMVSDAYPDYGAVAPEPGNVRATFALSLFVPDADATVAAAAAAGAKVQRGVEEQFHGARMGTLIDPFGVRWMINTQVRTVSAEAMAKAVEGFAEAGAERGPLDVE